MSTETTASRIGRAGQALQAVEPVRIFGRVTGLRGLLVEVAGPVSAMQVGGRLDVAMDGAPSVPCEVIGFSGDRALAMPFGSLQGVRRGCPAHVRMRMDGVLPSNAWLGRVVDALGQPIDGKGPLQQGGAHYPFRAEPPSPHARQRVAEPLDLGVRAINTFLTTCRGQRMGIFAGSGVGKSV